MISYAKRERAQRARAVVGVDAGKYSHTLVVRPRGGRDSRALTFRTTREGFEYAVAFIRDTVGVAPPQEILVGIEFAGNYGFTFAHYLDQLGFSVVSVLTAHTKRWKEVAHNQPVKTDAKDAGTITDLVAQGHFVGFPFLEPMYADLRYLVRARDRVSLLRRGTLTQLRTLLHVVFPEFEEIFPNLKKKTPLALLRAFPGPRNLLEAPRRSVLRVLHTASRGHLGVETYERLIAAARSTLGLPGAQRCLGDEIALTLERLDLFELQIGTLETRIVEALKAAPETPYLLSIPKVAPLTAGVFLGSIGDPQAYTSGREVLKLAGLSLIERSSGILRGRRRISKRGRPGLRAAAYMFAVRSITKRGLFRQEYEALLRRNGERKMAAVVAISRMGLELMFSIARDRRMFTVEPPACGWRRRDRSPSLVADRQAGERSPHRI